MEARKEDGKSSIMGKVREQRGKENQGRKIGKEIY